MTSPATSPVVFQNSIQERVISDCDAAQALPPELERVGAQRVFVVANRSLRASPGLEKILAALGSRFAGVFYEVRPFAPHEDVLQAAAAARQARADLLLAVGGGSVIDAAKVVLLCLRHGLTEPAQLEAYAGARLHNNDYSSIDAGLWLRMMAVPTTFSAAEYTGRGGATQPGTRLLQAFSDPMMMPQVVFNDPSMTLSAPLPLLLATGMKAVDHGVERLTSINANGYSDAVSSYALRLLCPALRQMKRDPGDLQARAAAQSGVLMSMRGQATRVRGGLSHAIGHQLGSHSGVSHGHTSCVVLPSVMHWLGDSIDARRALLCDSISPGTTADVAALLRALVRDLELPSRLRDVGVRREDLDLLAERTMHDPLIHQCPRKVASGADVREVLELAW